MNSTQFKKCNECVSMASRIITDTQTKVIEQDVFFDRMEESLIAMILYNGDESLAEMELRNYVAETLLKIETLKDLDNYMLDSGEVVCPLYLGSAFKKQHDDNEQHGEQSEFSWFVPLKNNIIKRLT